MNGAASDAAGSDAIARLFDRAFAESHTTVMIGGAAEPLYLPAGRGVPARVFFRADFAASALHEAAHWCIAGARRRRLVDYGYAYEPPPRDDAARRAFFAAEREVQALECVFARCAGNPFRISADDFAAGPDERDTFARLVEARAAELLVRGLPPRASVFAAALRQRFAPHHLPQLAGSPG